MITNQRVLFAGDNHSFALRIDDVIGFGMNETEVLISSARGTQRLEVPGTLQAQMVKSTFDKLLAQRSGILPIDMGAVQLVPAADEHAAWCSSLEPKGSRDESISTTQAHLGRPFQPNKRGD